MKKYSLLLSVGCLLLAPLALRAQYDNYTLIWSDEFNGGYTNADPYTGLDLDSWNYETGSGEWGWGTGQNDYSTTDKENVQVTGGSLFIRTQRHNANQPTHEYTSGRINSQYKRAFLYGKMEARIRTDNMTESGRGFAFWMLGNGTPAGTNTGWPQTGEIDIMEYNGLYPDYNLGSCHYAYSWDGSGNGNHAQASGLYYEKNRSTKFEAANHYDGCPGYSKQGTTKNDMIGPQWHVYGINWYSDRIEFYVRKDGATVDDVYAIYRLDQNGWCPVHTNNALGNIQSMTGYPSTQFSNYWRPFENPFYFVISAGVGGSATYGGNITAGNNPYQWTCTTEIDWVRVYKLNTANPPQITLALTKNGNNVTVTPTLTGGNAISKIEYILDKVPVASTATANPFTYTFTPTANQHLVLARACNANGYWGDWVKITYLANGTQTCDNIYQTCTAGGILRSSDWSNNGGSQTQNGNNLTATINGAYDNIYATWTGNSQMIVGDTYEFSGTVTSTVDGVVQIYLEDASNNKNQMFTANSIHLKANTPQSWKFVSPGGGFATPKFVLHVSGTTNGAKYTLNNVTLKSTACDAGTDPAIMLGTPAQITSQGGTTTVTVSGKNLKNNITVTSSNNRFTVNPTTLTQSGGNVNSAVTVTYSGNTTESTILTFTSGTTSSSVEVSSRIIGECDNYFSKLSNNHSLACTAEWSCGEYWGSTDIDGTTFTFSPNDTQTHFWAMVGGIDETMKAGTSYTLTGTLKSTAASTFTVNIQVRGDGDTKWTTAKEYTVAANGTVNFEMTASPTVNITDPEVVFNMESQPNSDYTVTNLSLKKSSCVGFPGITLNEPSGVITTTGGKATIAAKGVNLSANATVSSSNANFTVTPTTINVAGGTFTQTLTVTYNGQESESTVITVKSGDVTQSITVNSKVTGECSNFMYTLTGQRLLTCTADWACGSWGVQTLADNVFTFSQYDSYANTWAVVQGTGTAMPANVAYTLTGTIKNTGTAQAVVDIYVQDENNSDNNWGNTSSETLAAGASKNFSISGTPTIQLENPGVVFHLANQPATGFEVSNLVLKRSTCFSTASITALTATNACVGGQSTFSCTTNGFNGTPTITYQVSTDGGTTWNNATSPFTANTAGNYTLKATATAGGQTATKTATFTVNAKPTVAINADVNELTCATTTAKLTASGAQTYAWTGGPNTAVYNVTAAGTYTVTGTDANGCTNTAQKQITANNTKPTITIDADRTQLTCTNTTAKLTASGAQSYAWTGGPNTAVYNVTAAGTYTVTGTAANGCTNTAQRVITESKDLPTVAINADRTQLTCTEKSATLTASGTNIASYKWSTGETTAAITKNEAGTYTVTATANNGCTNTASQIITESKDVPTVNITANRTDLTCADATATLTASGNNIASYKWSTGETTAAITKNAAGTYTVTATANNGCTATASQAITENKTAPTVSINASADQVSCKNPQVSLTASGTGIATFAWTGGPNTATYNVTAAGNYTVTATGNNGCTATESKNITENKTAPTVSINASRTTIDCSGEAANLTAVADGNVSYAWSNGQTTKQISVTEAGTYSVTITGENGCTGQAQQEITADGTKPTISINASATEFTCATTNITLTAEGTGYQSLKWSNNATGNSIVANQAGKYSVTATAANGCTETAEITLGENKTAPTVTITADREQLTCTEKSATLTANSANATSYLWSTGETTATKQVSAAGSFSVTVTAANGCTAEASKDITADTNMPTVSIQASANAFDCLVNEITLTASGSGYDNLSWSTGETEASIKVTEAKKYTVTASANNGCEASAEITLSESKDAPTVSINADRTTIDCSGEAANLTAVADGNVTYLWSTGATTQQISVSQAGNYTVTVTAANGCTAEAQQAITADGTKPTVSIQASANDFTCATTNITLTAEGTGYQSLKWNNNATGNSIVADAAGTYSVIATAANGCTETAEITLGEDKTAPTVNITADREMLTCTEKSATLTANSADAASYLWSTGETTATKQVSAAGSFSVTVTAANGCTAEASKEITADTNMPTVSIQASANAFDCQVTEITLTAQGSGYDNLSWSTGETDESIKVSEAKKYTVTASANNGCEASAEITLGESKDAPTVSINADRTTIDCSGAAATLTAVVEGDVTYLWSTGETSKIISVSQAGNYTVTVTAANGCTGEAQQTISSDGSKPTVSINASATEFTCATANITLTAQGTGYQSLAWSNGDNGNSIVATQAGTYSVVATAANGCSETAEITLGENKTAPTVNITTDREMLTCTEKSATLTANSADAASYLWSTGETTATKQVSAAGNYSVTVTAANGCTAEASKEITADTNMPTVSIQASANAFDCQVNEITLTASGSGYDNLIWSTGESSASIVVNLAGKYTATVSANNGCEASAEITLNESKDAPTVSINADRTTIDCSGTPATLTAVAEGNVTYLWSTGESSNSIVVSTEGTYTVTVTAANGCTAQAQQAISVDNTVPTVSINADRTELNCQANTATLTATGNNIASYFWSNGSTDQQITVSSEGTYRVTVTSQSGCTAFAEQVITADGTMPVVNIVASQPIFNCNTTEISLSAFGSDFSSVKWSNNAVTEQIMVTEAGTYSVTATAANGCTAFAEITLNEDKAAPTVTVSADRNTIDCTGTPATLTASSANAVSYTWSNGQSGQEISVQSAGNYTVTAYASNGCSATADINIQADADMPVISIEPSATEYTCNISEITLTAKGSGYASLQWSNGSTDNSIVVTGFGPYTLSATSTGGCTAQTQISLGENKTPASVSINADRVVLTCTEKSAKLSAVGTDLKTYKWSTGETTPSISKSAAGTYTVTVTGANGCEGSANIELTESKVLPAVSIEASSTTITCSTTEVVLTATGDAGNTYKWSSGENTATITKTATGTYRVTATGANGCQASSQIRITRDKTKPTVSISADYSSLTCANPLAQLTATGTGISSYKWSNGETAASITADAAGTYQVTVTGENGCTGTASKTLTANITKPTVSVIASAEEFNCQTTSIMLLVNGSNFTSVSWSNGSTSTTQTVTAAGNYVVTATAKNGCTAEAAINLTENKTLPQVSAVANRTELTCAQPSATLTASGNAEYYQWNTGETDASITKTAVGTYTVTGTAANGCTAQAQVSLTERKDLPVVSISADITELTCTNPVAQLTASGASSYVWNTNETSAQVSKTTRGTYVVTGTGENGCTAQASIKLSENKTQPSVLIVAERDALSNEHPTMVLESRASNVSYLWNTGATSDTLKIDKAGIYSLMVTSLENGCTNSDNIEVKYKTAVQEVEAAPALTVIGGKGQITIISEEPTNVKLSNIIGQNYFSGTIDGVQVINTLSPGIYLVQQLNGSKQVIKARVY